MTLPPYWKVFIDHICIGTFYSKKDVEDIVKLNPQHEKYEMEVAPGQIHIFLCGNDYFI